MLILMLLNGAAVTYGKLVQAIINFVIILFVVWAAEKLKKKEEVAPAAMAPTQEELYSN
jgi:large-conductance mechanosensitive channel